MNHEEQKVEAMEQVEAQPVEPTDVDSEVTAEQARIAELEAQLDAAQQASLEERERAIRAVAEMENLRRRAAQDVEKAQVRAGEVRRRTAAGTGQPGACHRAGRQGKRGAQADDRRVELTLKSMQSSVGKFGLNPLDPLNQPFDPMPIRR